MAIKAVLEICQSYNKTKRFNAFGFGAQLPPAYTVSHLFPLNLHYSEVEGIDGVMQAYNVALRHTTLYGPTNFAPTINEAAKRAAYYPTDGSHYQILLIITDGVISDMSQTKNAIIMASTLPLSVNIAIESYFYIQYFRLLLSVLEEQISTRWMNSTLTTVP